MTDLPSIPEEYREDIERVCRVLREQMAPSATTGAAIERLEAGLPPKRRFTDDDALAFYRALFPRASATDGQATSEGYKYLDRLAAAGWTAPPALCPDPEGTLDDLIATKAGGTPVLVVTSRSEYVAAVSPEAAESEHTQEAADPIPVDEVEKRLMDTACFYQADVDVVLDVLRDLNRERGHG